MKSGPIILFGFLILFLALTAGVSLGVSLQVDLASQTAAATNVVGPGNLVLDRLQTSTKRLKRQSRSLTAMIDLAKARQTDLLKLATTRPQSVLVNRLSAAERSRLPVEVQAYVESDLTQSGTLQALIAEDFNHQQTQTTYYLQSPQGAKRVLILTGGAKSYPSPGSQVQVSGLAIGDNLLLAESARVTSTKAPAARVALGVKRVAVILVKLASQPEVLTPAAAQDLIFDSPNSVNAFYQDNSYGQMSLAGQVYGPYSLDYPASNVCLGGLAPGVSVNQDFTNQSLAAAAGNDFVRSNYDQVIIIFSTNPGCRFMGITDTDSLVWINPPANISTTQYLFLLAHELGHNLLTTLHARSLLCQANGQPVAISPTCTSQDPSSAPGWGDPFDVMGSYPPPLDFSGFRKQIAGWFKPSNIAEVANGTYQLYALEKPSTGFQTLRVPIAGGSFYYLEYRSKVGLLIKRAGIYAPNQVTELIDTTPGSASGFKDAALAVGQSFVDVAGGVEIKNLSADTNSATVRVSQPNTTPLLSLYWGDDENQTTYRIQQGETVWFHWRGSYVTSCRMTSVPPGAWQGGNPLPTTGDYGLRIPDLGDYTLTLTCTNDAGTPVSRTLHLNIGTQPVTTQPPASPPVSSPSTRLTINLPRGGEVWRIGDTKEINWSETNYTYAPGLYKLYASTQTGSWYGEINQTGELSLNWNVGQVKVNGVTQTLSPGNYWIQVIKQDGQTRPDGSAVNQVISQGSIELLPSLAPTLNFYWGDDSYNNSLTVTQGETAWLHWLSNGATSCQPGSTPNSPWQQVNTGLNGDWGFQANTVGTYTLNLACGNQHGSVVKGIRLVVN